MRMEEKGVRHLAVEDQNGQIVSVIDSKSLIQFQRYGPMVLAREIARADTPDEVAQCCERTSPLVKSSAGQQRPPAPRHQHAGVHLRRGHRAADPTGGG